MRRNKTVHALSFMLSFAWHNKKIYLLYLVGEQLFYYLAAIVSMTAPKYVMKYLFETPDIRLFIFTVLSYVLIIFLLKSIAQFMRVNVYVSSYALNQIFSAHIGETTSKLEFQYIEDSEIGQLHDRAVNCVYRNGFFGPLEEVVALGRELIMILSTVVILLNVTPIVILLIVLMAIINMFTNLMLNKRKIEQEKHKINSERKCRYIGSVFSDVTYGIEIRANNLYDFLHEKMVNNLNVIKKINENINCIVVLSDDIRSVTSIIQHIGLYTFLAMDVLTKGLGIGSFTLCFNAVNQFSNSLDLFLKGYVSLNEMGLYIDDLDNFLALPQMDNGHKVYESIPENSQEIVFENVSFRYPEQESYVLKHINLKLLMGERIAIVGANGAGKTTLIKLLLRLYTPTEGRILYGGKDIQEFCYEEYIKKFAAVFQDYKLFAFSIEENICLGEDKKKEVIEEIIDKSGLSEVVNNLPLKGNTPLYKVYDDAGIELSGGELQKLAIARALYKNAPIVILDEPTSFMDPISEYELYQKYDTLTDEKTTIYISHRLTSTRFSQKIVVLDQGVIAEMGSHDELMKRGGLYAKMYIAQAEKYFS